MSSCTKLSLTILGLGSPAFMEKATHRSTDPSAGEAKVGGYQGSLARQFTWNSELDCVGGSVSTDKVQITETPDISL